MFKLLASAFKRLMTAVTSPFRMIIVKIQKLFNINIITAKLIAPLTKKVKSLITLKPQSIKDYISIGKLWVYKKLFLSIVLVLCAGVFIYFTMFAPKVTAQVVSPVSVITDINYDYDDMDLKDFTGVANICAADGSVVYTGDIVAGVCKGNGSLKDRSGKLIYKGSFDLNEYNGIGIAYYLSGNIKYEGDFANNLFEGEGTFYADDETVLYSGEFQKGLYSGEGKQYSNTGILLYEGSFLEGNYHGSGISYYEDGTTRYKGEFFGGLPQGSGILYNTQGRQIYTGAVYEGVIDYRSFVNATLADVEMAFAETPRVFYSDMDSTFVFEQAGVIITVDCRVKVDIWEKEATDDTSSNYYLPNELQASASSYSISAVKSLTLNADILSKIKNITWYSTSTSSETSSDTSSGTSSGTYSDTSSEIILNDSSTLSSSSASSSESIQPDFVEKNQVLYFEIDTDVWQSEEELDKSKVLTSKVTVFNIENPVDLTNVTLYDDNSPASIEDCVAIDCIRQTIPTAFSNVIFEMDKQNKLFVNLQTISYADKIIRNTFVQGGLTYDYCYQMDEPDKLMYFSIQN